MRGQWRNKRDANEAEIVQELRAYGFSVEHMDKPVDLLIGKHGQTWIAEVKMEGKKLNSNQVAFFDRWRGNKLILRSIEDVADFYNTTQRTIK
jgi:hypothetical protein